MIQHADYIEQAHKHIKSFDFPAAANALRKACEASLKRILPENWLYSEGKDGSYQLQTLHGLISQATKLNEHYEMSLPLENLDVFRDRILNPFSHDDLKTPLYRGVLMMLLSEIENLENVKKYVFMSLDMIGKESYRFELPTDIGVLSADLVFREQFSAIKYQGKVYYANSEIRVSNCTLKSWNKRTGSLRRFLRDMTLRAKIEPMTGYEYIYNPRVGKSIAEIIDLL